MSGKYTHKVRAGMAPGWRSNPQIADELRDRGVKASRNRVARLMYKEAIRSIMYKIKPYQARI